MKLTTRHKEHLPRSVYLLLVAVIVANAVVTFIMFRYFK